MSAGREQSSTLHVAAAECVAPGWPLLPPQPWLSPAAKPAWAEPVQPARLRAGSAVGSHSSYDWEGLTSDSARNHGTETFMFLTKTSEFLSGNPAEPWRQLLLQLLMQLCACWTRYKERLLLSRPLSEMLFWRGQVGRTGNRTRSESSTPPQASRAKSDHPVKP